MKEREGRETGSSAKEGCTRGQQLPFTLSARAWVTHRTSLTMVGVACGQGVGVRGCGGFLQRRLAAAQTTDRVGFVASAFSWVRHARAHVSG